MDLSSIGKNIRKHRLKKELKQEQLAELTELSPNYIGMIERGEKIPSLDTFISIINALDVSADEILADVTNKGINIKTTLLQEKIDLLSKEKQNTVFDLIDVIIKHNYQ